MSDLESGGEAGGVALPAAADLARELRVLVRLRSPASVKQAELPALRSRCGDDLAGCVDRAIAGIAETKYRAAAEALLGSGDGRWSTLERRGQSAAEAFGLTTYDAYRKPRRSTTTSHMEETLELVAEAMVAHSADAERPPETIGDPVSTPRRGGLWNARRGVAAVVLGVVVLAGVIAVLMTRSSGGAEPGRRAGAHPAAVTHSPAAMAHCPAKVGDLPPASPPELSRFVAPFHAAVASSGFPLCAAAPIERWQNLIFQRLQNASGHPDGVVIGADPAHVLRLTEAEYSSYHQFGGKNGERAQAIAGLPLSLYTDHSASILRTANGGFVSEGRDQPGYFVGSTVWDTWQRVGAPPASTAWPPPTRCSTATVTTRISSTAPSSCRSTAPSAGSRWPTRRRRCPPSLSGTSCATTTPPPGTSTSSGGGTGSRMATPTTALAARAPPRSTVCPVTPPPP